MVQVSHGSTQGSERSTYATYHQVLTTLIEASTNVNTAHTDTKNETLLLSLRMTNNHSSIATLQTSTASGQARDNFTAHFALTVISTKKDTSIQQIGLPLSKQTHSLLATSKSASSNAVTVSSFSSVSALLTESSSSLNYELFSRTAISPNVSTDISAMNIITMTSEMVIFNSTYRVASKTSITPQNSLTVGGNSNLFSNREGSATTAVNHTVRTLPTKTATSTAWSSSSSSLSSTSILSYTTVVIDKSSFQTTSRSVTGRRTSDNQDRQTVNISIQRSSSIMFDSSVSLKPASLVRMSSHSSKLVFNQSTSLGSNTLESMLEDRSSSEIHVTIATTDEPVGVSKTKTTGDNFTSGMRFRTTMTLGSLTKTILPSFHTKGSEESFSVTSMVAQTSAFLRPNGDSGSFDVSSLPGFAKGTESLQTYPRTVALSMPATTSTPKPELNTSYNMSTWLETIILAQTSKMSTEFSGISVSIATTGTSTFSTSIKEAKVRINSSDMRTTDSILESSLDTFASATNTNMKSAMFQTSDGVSTYPITQSLTAESLFSVKGSSTSTLLTASTAGSGSRLQFQTLAHSSFSLPFSVSPGVSLITTQKPPRVVSVPMQDKSSTSASIITVPSPSTDGTFSFAVGLLSISNIKEQRTSSVLSSTLSTPTDTLPWKTSTPHITYDDSKASTIETFSRGNAPLYSTHNSLQLVSTSATMKRMVSNSSLNTNQLSTRALLHSTHVLTSKYVNRTQGLQLTSVPSSLRSRPVGYVTHTRDTSTTLTSTSASLRDNITDEITVESSVFAPSSHATIPNEQPFGSVSTNTLSSSPIWTSSKTKETLDSIQIQSSPSQETSSFTSRTTASISPDTTEHFATATTALVATVGVSTPTELPTASPKQFDVSIKLRMTWKPNYEFSFTLEFQALASKIKTLVTAVLKTVDGFLSLIVLRFWKGSVGVDFVVFVNKNAEVSENTLEGTIIEANSTGVLDLPLTSIQVQERETTTIPSSTQSRNEDKSIERWVIILIVAGILVFLMLLIISCLLVSEL